MCAFRKTRLKPAVTADCPLNNILGPDWKERGQENRGERYADKVCSSIGHKDRDTTFERVRELFAARRPKPGASKLPARLWRAQSDGSINAISGEDRVADDRGQGGAMIFCAWGDGPVRRISPYSRPIETWFW